MAVSGLSTRATPSAPSASAPSATRSTPSSSSTTPTATRHAIDNPPTPSSPGARIPHRRQSAPDLMNSSQSSASRTSSPPSASPPRRRNRESASSQRVPPSDDRDSDTLVPTVFNWKFPGQLVYVAGAWDGWRRKAPLYRNGRDHLALLYIPTGEFQCKFYVDDNWQCAPDLPTRTDEYGNTNNIIKVTEKDPHFDSAAPLLENKPLSPLSSYKQNPCADFPADPPVLPPHLQARTLTILPQEELPPELPESDEPPEPEIPRNSAPHDGAPGSNMAPHPFFSYVYINHLYHGRAEQEDEDVQSLSQTTRIGDRVVNTVLVTTKHARESLNEVNNLECQP